MSSPSIISPNVCLQKEQFPCMYCEDDIKSMINSTASVSVDKTQQDPPEPTREPYLGTSCLGGVFLRKEALKIGLYSDDSSTDSSDSDLDDDFDEEMTNPPKRMLTPHNVSCNTQCIVPGKNPLAHLPQNGIPSSSDSISSSTTISTYPATISSIPSHYATGSTTRKRKRCSTRGNKKKRSVSLNKSVSVIPIPSRAEYSCQIRERIWSSSEELYANAARNSVEFASEGWNWRDAVEDEGMLVHKPTGELIHPIHLQNALACFAHEEKVEQPIRTTNVK